MSRHNQIRNFSIIAHIDHGKSTLADRLIELTGGLSKREMEDQVLDTLELERERGITIKAQSVCLNYRARDGQDYMLNLIDTPGHVDFTYEVSRSLAACEGALLVVDAAQGVEAQTLANVYLALEQDLEILPVLNKVDLPSADPARVAAEIESVVGLDASQAVQISAKTGFGVEEVLEQIVAKVPPPSGDTAAPLQALVYDAWFDAYLGVMVMVRVVNGTVRIGDTIRFMAAGKAFEVATLGKFTPNKMEVDALTVGEVGFLSAAIKIIHDARVGDTLTMKANPAKAPLSGYAPVKPMVFSGLYPADGEAFDNLKSGLEKLALNDAALSYELESSVALGFGFRCRFLGLLHMEIVQERLERELDISLITTAPTVVYEVHLKNGEAVMVENPNLLPQATRIEHIAEPYIKGRIITPTEYVGGIMKICLDRRGEQKGIQYLDENRVMLEYEFPLNEIILDFYDKLKSSTRGYGSFDYDHIGFRKGDLVKLDVLINGEPVDALSLIVPRDKAPHRGRELVSKLRRHIHRQLFEVVIQAAIGSKIVARETVSAMRKNVTAKCYGGDITRKRKLLEKQKAGKKRMKQIGTVEVPQEAFMAVLRLGE
ncbi:MAG: translation elongation factor 4 [SAR324 cluster bacterium]|nr:translation elongation factor 4 [SAR324 cluster bacterium]MCZ6843868.1 translation elongation factor 4 [SAR324 cluster bacterium]